MLSHCEDRLKSLLEPFIWEPSAMSLTFLLLSRVAFIGSFLPLGPDIQARPELG